MIEFELGGAQYRAEKLNAFEQADVAALLLPVVSGAADAIVRLLRSGGDPKAAFGKLLESDVSALFQPLAKAMAAMPREDRREVITLCLSKVSRAQQGAVGWARLTTPQGAIMYADVAESLPLVLQIVWRVLEHSLLSFSLAPPAAST